MEGDKAALFAILGLGYVIIMAVVLTNVTPIMDAEVSQVLNTVGIVVLFLGLMGYLATMAFMNTAPTAVLHWCVFVTHVVTLPLAIFGTIAAASSIADAKNLLSQSGK